MLTKTFSLLSVGLILGLTSIGVVAATKDKATELPKNCQYLKEVATNQTHIRKQIDAIGKNNFNTDFAVPSGVKFASFKGVMGLFVTCYGSIGGHKSTKSLSGKRLN